MPNPNTGPFSPITPFAAGGGGGGAWESVGSRFTLGSPAATLIISGFDNTSVLWMVLLNKLQPTVVSRQFQMEMRLGGSFPSDFRMHDHSMTQSSGQSAYAGQNAAGAERIRITAGNVTNDAGFAGNLAILISNPGATDERKTLRYSGEIWLEATPNRIQVVLGVGGHDTSNDVLDALKIRYNNDNIAAGLIVDLYKLIPPA